ncbi:MAG: hypothetical protein WBC30_12330, partial [Candidatus Sulfotelmatobacter sp.]
MAEIGSFALLLALALSVYSFLAGIIALVFQNQTSALAATPGAGAAYRASAALSPQENWLVAILRRGSER